MKKIQKELELEPGEDVYIRLPREEILLYNVETGRLMHRGALI